MIQDMSKDELRDFKEALRIIRDMRRRGLSRNEIIERLAAVIAKYKDQGTGRVEV